MRTFLLLAAMALSLHAAAQATRMDDKTLHTGYDVLKDSENEQVVYKGQISFADIQAGKTFDWFRDGEKEYKPDAAAVNYLRQNLGDYELVVFLGTWCDDSHNIIPKLYKTLLEAGYNGYYTMYGTDRAKTTKGNAHEQYNIKLVPTIIVLNRYKVEVGRITETVKNSVEQDLADILKSDLPKTELH